MTPDCSVMWNLSACSGPVTADIGSHLQQMSLSLPQSSEESIQQLQEKEAAASTLETMVTLADQGGG